jgi:hypothetical protein
MYVIESRSQEEENNQWSILMHKIEHATKIIDNSKYIQKQNVGDDWYRLVFPLVEF